MTNWTDIFIKRPVLATVLSLLILLVGIISYFKLPLRLYPEISSTVISVGTTYRGADAKLMESFVSTPIENAIAGIDGVDYMTSTNTMGSSDITIYFKLGYDINAAIADITNKVASVRNKLPQNIEDPIIEKEDPNATPIMFIPFSSKTMPREEITDYLIRAVQPELETVPGLAEAKILGAREYAMRIWLNPQKMSALGVTADDIQQVLSNNNVQSATGHLEAKEQELNITASTDLNTAKQFNNLVIKQGNGHLVRLEDVGHAELGPEDDRFSVIYMDTPAVVVAILPKADANPLSVATGVKKVLSTLRMPNDLTSYTGWDSTKFIAASIKEVQRTIIEATCFVIVVIFLFLGSIRTLLIPSITIPLSLIGVMGFMLMMGYSLNTITFLAMVLAIGMVVDDAIVVSENIHRHIEEGKTVLAAAKQGASEIRFVIVAMTFTLAAVFAPIGFMGGLVGSLFKEFAFTLAGAVIVSGFIALTLSPMMCSKVMSEKALQGRLPDMINRYFIWINKIYRQWLLRVLKGRILVVVFLGFVLGGCLLLYSMTPKELAPQEDIGGILTMAFAPSSANLAYTEKYTQQIEQIYTTVPEMTNYVVINGFPAGVNSALSFLSLKPWRERKRSSNEIIGSLFPLLWSITGIRAFPVNPSQLPGSEGGLPINFVLKTIGSYQELYDVTQKLLASILQNPGFVNVDADPKLDKSQIDVEIARDKAGDLGVSMSNIGNTLAIALSEPIAGYFSMDGRSYEVIPQVYDHDRTTPDILNDLNVRTASGELVPLSNLIKIHESIQPESLTHFQQLRAATIRASLAPGYTMGEALNFLEKTAQKIMPSTMQYDYAGELRQLVEASGEMQKTFIFAILFIYLVLAAQFESFRDPCIVMISVPLSIVGALLAMMLTHSTLNIYTEIGLVTLIGLISKHGILMVEFANQWQEQTGADRKTAILEAASVRLRPILMTTAAMLLGAVPLAFATGAGAISRQQIGWVIIGGMSIGTLFTLFVIPVIYSLMAKQLKSQH